MRLAELLNKIALLSDVTFTVLTGNGRFFSAGADVQANSEEPPSPSSRRRHYLSHFAAVNMAVARAFYEHPKVR